ncbi:phosphate ABC transporter substrate-binding protein PstS [Kocuria sp. SM24M-10]|uniref:phosphate ABC transporter substrate-binding protein PstS n=1 Tax=Kocuria sp. SM24M-10 TaxID=1660349 RepID=UPI00064A01CF|nr:phosphate ABC transporter substrate-binding protein PstS [Kocuria sp. SM24M-10]KLU08069.1 phosphate ABC transporter substrate-binding protein [Kocuria sp. SM24M-10]
MLNASRPRRRTRTVRLLRTGAVTALALTALAGCGSDYPLGEEQRRAAEQGGSDLSGILTGVGSSAQNAAMLTWRSGFESRHPDAQVQYLSAGSGAGRSALVGGGTDFAGSDAYLDEEEQAEVRQFCGPDGAINIPVYISPISVAFNLPGIQELNLDATTIAGIFRGEITRWDDPAIAAQNEGVDLPDLPITPIARADDSGTTENFTDYLHSVAPEAWPDEEDGSWPGSLPTERSQGNAGVVSLTAGTEGAVTYADDSLVDESLGKARVKVGSEYVAVSGEAAGTAVGEASRVEGTGPHDIALELDREPDAAGAYPVVLVSYHVYCTSYTDPEVLELARAFGHYVVSEEGQRAAAEAVQSAPLPDNLRTEAQEALDSIGLR